jgi:hypothetical protein
MQARDERAVCEVERASSRGERGDGQPVERSKPRVGHGEDWLLFQPIERKTDSSMAFAYAKAIRSCSNNLPSLPSMLNSSLSTSER